MDFNHELVAMIPEWAVTDSRLMHVKRPKYATDGKLGVEDVGLHVIALEFSASLLIVYWMPLIYVRWDLVHSDCRYCRSEQHRWPRRFYICLLAMPILASSNRVLCLFLDGFS